MNIMNQNNLKPNAADQISEHLTYNQMCYNYVEFRKIYSKSDTNEALFRLFGQSWVRHCEGIDIWYEESYKQVGY